MTSYILTIEEKPTYLHARVTGTNSVENVLSYLAEVHAACVQQNYSAVLIEENLSGPSVDLTSIYEIVSARSHYTTPQLRRIAYVDMNPEHDAARMKFAETVAVNRSVNVRLFSTLQEAVGWLTE